MVMLIAIASVAHDPWLGLSLVVVWMDVQDEDAVVPRLDGLVVMKAARLKHHPAVLAALRECSRPHSLSAPTGQASTIHSSPSSAAPTSSSSQPAAHGPSSSSSSSSYSSPFRTNPAQPAAPTSAPSSTPAPRPPPAAPAVGSIVSYAEPALNPGAL